MRNRVNRTVKEALVAALNSDGDDGGTEFFRRLKNSKLAADRHTFAHLCARLIPAQTDLDVTVEGPSVVVYIPDNQRGPSNGESTKQYKDRMSKRSGK